MSKHWLGVDLGGTKILAGLLDDDLNVLARSKQPTSIEYGPDGVIERVVQAVETVVRESQVDPASIAGMGFAIPGQIVPGQSIVRFAPNLGWRDVDIQKLLPATWTWPVTIENDVRMGTYGEFAHGAARGAKHVFGIFAGTGVGGGLILNGELFHGFNGHAGEIGHIVLSWRRARSLESIAGRKYMMKRAKKLLDEAPKRVRKDWKGVVLERVKSSQLAEFYAKDDPIAVRIVDDAARALGAAIASVTNLISPEVIVIGGGVTEALGTDFFERIQDFTKKSMLPGSDANMRIVQSTLGDDAGITGCAAYVKAKGPQ